MKMKDSPNSLFAIVTVISLFLVLACAPKATYAQATGPTPTSTPSSDKDEEVIRVHSDLVTVPVTVMDREGRYVTKLTEEDFLLFENGVEQKVSHFEGTRSPVTALLLLDVSGSMQNRLSELASAANRFVEKLRPDDQLIAVQFCGYIKVLSRLAPVREIKGKGLKLNSCGWTRLYDAVDFAYAKLRKVSGRKAIILFSDGADAGISARYPVAFVTEKDNYRLAKEGEPIVYTIQFDTFAERRHLCKPNPKQCEKDEATARRYMETMPSITGGKQIIVGNESDLERAFTNVADELGQQYLLGYYPDIKTGQKEERQIRVRVKRPGLAVRSRKSYIPDPKNH